MWLTDGPKTLKYLVLKTPNTHTVFVLNKAHALINAHPLFQLIYGNFFQKIYGKLVFVTSHYQYQSSIPLSKLIDYFTKTLSLCTG